MSHRHRKESDLGKIISDKDYWYRKVEALIKEKKKHIDESKKAWNDLTVI
jgi:hypothetical protein